MNKGTKIFLDLCVIIDHCFNITRNVNTSTLTIDRCYEISNLQM